MNPEKIFKSALIVAGLCSLITLGVVGYVWYTENRNLDRAYDIAQQLGHQPELHMAQSRQCWGFYTGCGIYIHFITDLDLDTFSALVDNLPLTHRRSGREDGGTIFTDINTSTSHELKVYRHLTSPAHSSVPLAHRWYLNDQDSKSWKVVFYELRDGLRYEFDGQPIEGAIVTVIYQIN